MMILEIIITLLLGMLACVWGIRFGRVLLRKGATADNLFKGKNAVSLLFLGLYIGLLLLALYVPQFQGLPLEWRVYGMRVTWTIMRVTLLGFCGLALIVSWHTARMQVIAVMLLGLIGLGGFTLAESYFLAPIYASLKDNIQPNGVFWQTSNSSCAPAALATVLHRWGLDATESSVARLAGTSRLGTSMPQLIVAAQALGMDGIELSPTWEQMQQVNRPGVLAAWLYGNGSKAPHAIGLLAMDANTATIADPAFGDIFEVPRSRLMEIWRGQYVPIYRDTDTVLTPAQTADYLKRLGYLDRASTPSPKMVKLAIQHFQDAMGVNATGKLDAETALLLSGPFLTGVPTLNSNHTIARSASSSAAQP
jgi:predicted double-glycine peptidase